MDVLKLQQNMEMGTLKWRVQNCFLQESFSPKAPPNIPTPHATFILLPPEKLHW